MDVEIADQRGIAQLADQSGLERVTIDAAALKLRGLLPVTLRRALWAVRPGGEITIRDDGRRAAEAAVGDMTFNQVCQAVFHFLGRDTETLGVDPGGTVVLRRTTPALGPGWSAGIVFSGAVSEVELLHACLAGVLRQPEVSEVVVCGPTGGEDMVSARDSRVRYLPFDADQSFGRVMIARKKNVLLDALHQPRRIVLHTRIELRPGAIAGVPGEFDLLAPNVLRRVAGREEPYLSLARSAMPWPGYPAPSQTRFLRDVARGDPLELHRGGPCYVDGGAFMVTERTFAACRLDDRLAWGEGEDVEWCARAYLAGHVPDIALRCSAVSLIQKWSARGLPRPVDRLLRRGMALARQGRGIVRRRLG